MIAYNNITNFTKRPTADDEAVYTDYGSAGLKEYFSPPKESTVPTERTNSVVSSSAAIFGEITFYDLIRNNILVFICIVQGFVMNKVQLDDTTQLMVLIPTTVLLLVLAYCISRQPQSTAELAFSVSHFIKNCKTVNQMIFLRSLPYRGFHCLTFG